ncbi:MAG: hydrogenase iron-sulfur subunit [Bacteroidales bacterium]|nr:hydrogenase iron-sulfur subunit [Bacteroidales bacterium]
MEQEKDFVPKILVFSTDKISDPGIDLAGQQHIHYPPTVYTIIVPCSAGIKPRWILRAFNKGLDGVFIAADGTDCPFSPDCSEKTGKLAANTQELMKKGGINPARLKMAAVCSVCALPFSNHMKNFSKTLSELGSVQSENYKEEEK